MFLDIENLQPKSPMPIKNLYGEFDHSSSLRRSLIPEPSINLLSHLEQSHGPISHSAFRERFDVRPNPIVGPPPDMRAFRASLPPHMR